MLMPDIGARIYVRPTAPNIQAGAGAFGRFLPVGEWRGVVMDEWWCSRILDGSVQWLSALPAEKPAAPKGGK